MKVNKLRENIWNIYGKAYTLLNYNSYFILDDKVALIDPAFLSEEEFISSLNQMKLSIKDIDIIISTHWHSDHSSKAWYIKEHSNAEYLIHRLDAPLMESVNSKISGLGKFINNKPFLDSWKEVMNFWDFREVKVDTYLEEGDIISLGKNELRVIHTPGHTEGHCCFEMDNSGERILFAGDISPRERPWYGYVTSTLDDYITSLERLMTEEWDSILSGHYKIYRKYIKDIGKMYRGVINTLLKREERVFDSINEGHSTVDELIGLGLMDTLDTGSVWYDFTEYCHVTKHLKRLENMGRINRSMEGGVEIWVCS